MKSGRKIKSVIEILRPQFWLPALGPAIAGMLIASGSDVCLSKLLILAFIFMCICGGAETINDFFDRHTDRINKVKTVFKINSSGGSGVLQSGVINSEGVLFVSILLFTISLILALAFSYIFFILVLVGIFFAITYSAPPFRWKNKGALAGIVRSCAYGCVTFNAGWYAGSNTFSIYPLLVSSLLFVLVFGYSTTADLADYFEDKENNIKTLPVRIGPKKTLTICILCIMFAFFAIHIMVFLKMLNANLLIIPFTLVGIFTMIILTSVYKSFSISKISQVHMIGILIQGLFPFVFFV